MDKGTGSPLVSVIMPAYNAEKYIAAAINSLLQQTFTAWELIVVDDGSSDNTASIIKGYVAKDSRVIYLYQDHERQGKARNNGLRHATGEYTAFLDADDLWMPQILDFLLRTILANNVDLIFSDAYIFEEELSVENKLNIIPGYYKGHEGVRKLLWCNQISSITLLAKSSAIKSVNGFSEKKEIHEDYDLWLRMLINGSSFLGVNSTFAYYRRHANSSSLDAGKVLLYDINVLQSIATEWRVFKHDVDTSLIWRINHYMATNNVNSRKMLLHLLDVRNSLTGDNVSFSFWKKVYSFLGKDIFRILFNLRMKRRLATDNSKKVRVSHI